MPRTLLCTTGTSIAQGCPALTGFQRRPTTWDDDALELTQQIRQRVQALNMVDARDCARASAELNALHRLPLAPDDQVVLLATDTADGRCCAEAVRAVLQAAPFKLPDSQIRIERVAGLQVRDAERLRTEGLANLVRLLISYLDDPQRRWGGGCVLCPNGGFKGIVPFMTILGMMFRAPVVYVFEFAEALITLPPLPFGFATDLFERALPALRWAGEQGVFDPADFYRRVAGFVHGEKELFDGFLELAPDGADRTLASLSPLAEVLSQREGGEQPEIGISAVAASDLAQLDATARMEVEDHLRKLASPLWRSQHRDSKYSNDLDFYPRGHNPWRFAGFDADGKFHLCWFARHGEYERQMSLLGRQRRAFDATGFSTVAMPQVEHKPLAPSDPDAGLNWLDLRAQRDAALHQAALLAAAMEKLERQRAQERADLQSRLAQANRQIKLATAERQAREAEQALLAAQPAAEQPSNE